MSFSAAAADAVSAAAVGSLGTTVCLFLVSRIPESTDFSIHDYLLIEFTSSFARVDCRMTIRLQQEMKRLRSHEAGAAYGNYLLDRIEILLEKSAAFGFHLLVQ